MPSHRKKLLRDLGNWGLSVDEILSIIDFDDKVEPMILEKDDELVHTTTILAYVEGCVVFGRGLDIFQKRRGGAWTGRDAREYTMAEVCDLLAAKLIIDDVNDL